MELKLISCSYSGNAIQAFNRTIMELKRDGGGIDALWRYSFNRTIMELKLYQAATKLLVMAPFNRTIMELKQNPAYKSISFINDF